MKIAICTPVYRDTTGSFTYSLAKMLIHSVREGVDVDYLSVSSSRIDRNRTELVQRARLVGATAILWADADHVFPEDSLLRLVAHNLPIVGVNYPKRTVPTVPTAVGMDGRPIYGTGDGVETVGSLGLGLCLIAMEVFDAVGNPAFRFCGESLGEDADFFVRALSAGYQAHVDHGLSASVGHTHEVVLTNATAAAQRAEYERQHPPPP
jgi:hypothetical protein